MDVVFRGVKKLIIKLLFSIGNIAKNVNLLLNNFRCKVKIK